MFAFSHDAGSRSGGIRHREVSILSVGLLLPTGFSVLSFAPIAVFETANGVAGERFYDIHLVSETGKRVANSLGRSMDTELLGERSRQGRPAGESLIGITGGAVTHVSHASRAGVVLLYFSRRQEAAS
jgi:transcriptional regulator GlxA family with amidase domain